LRRLAAANPQNWGNNAVPASTPRATVRTEITGQSARAVE